MKKILIVEDQRMPRENMERMIAESGRYESAGSISDAGLALARCCRIPVDLILKQVNLLVMMSTRNLCSKPLINILLIH